MNTIPEKYADRPNLYRLACELATYKEPDRVLNALKDVLSANVKGGADHDQL